MQITYNSLNLPTSLKLEGGKSVRYVYDAKGKKLQASYVTTTPSSSMTLDYCDNMIYENGKLTQILVDGGYISFANGEAVYHYYLKDHLGSNRVVVNQATGKVEQVNHYYPFGGLMAESTGGNGQRYKYNDKELDRMHGLDWYDYGARFYDAILTRWTAMDPLCEKYPWTTPYGYCLSNPVNAFDPNGRVVFGVNKMSRLNILRTLSSKENEYIKFDEQGRIDNVLINKCDSKSVNFVALKALANSDLNYIFTVSDKDINGFAFYEKGENKQYPKNFSYGVTNIPGAANDASPNENVYIYTANFLDEKMQVRNTAHEGYGHAYFYELSRTDPSVMPFHTFGIVDYVEEFDSYYNLKVQTPVFGKNNIKLEEQIQKVEKQALENYEKEKY